MLISIIVLVRASDSNYSRYPRDDPHKDREQSGESESRQCNDHSDIHSDYLLNILQFTIKAQASGACSCPAVFSSGSGASPSEAVSSFAGAAVSSCSEAGFMILAPHSGQKLIPFMILLPQFGHFMSDLSSLILDSLRAITSSSDLTYLTLE